MPGWVNRVPQGFYHIDLLLKSVLRKGKVLFYGTCLQARAMTEEELVSGARVSSMPELAELTLVADKVLVF